MGNYVIQNSLGVGGQGQVYLGRDVVLRRAVAVKVINGAADGSTNLQGLEEARLIAMLDHPNIVRVYHVERVSKSWFVAMEYVEGGNVEELVLQSGPLQAEKALRFVSAVADALQHAHEVGVIHQDIKPHNLLITKAGSIKLADFGLAGRPDVSMREREWVGTPQYMAPEAWKGRPVVQSDIYSLGCCLYFMMTGRPPFPESSLEELKEAHRRKELHFPSGFNADVREFIGRLLKKKAEGRPQSADEVVREAERLLARLEQGPQAVQAPSVAPAAEPPRSESRLPIISDGRRAQAEASALAIPPLVACAKELSRAISNEGRPVVLHGPDEARLLALTESVLSKARDRFHVLAELKLSLPDEQVAEGLASACGARGAKYAGSVDKLNEMLRSGGNRHGVVKFLFRRPATAPDAMELAELVRCPAAARLRWLVLCDSGSAQQLVTALSISKVPSESIQAPTLHGENLIKFAEGWTAAASDLRLRWSRDALLLLSHLDRQDPGGSERRVHDATSLALNAKLGVVTTWCVMGASAHSGEIRMPCDVGSDWLVPPARWPDEAMFSLLSRLRSS